MYIGKIISILVLSLNILNSCSILETNTLNLSLPINNVITSNSHINIKTENTSFFKRDDIVSDTGRHGNQEIYIMKPDGTNQIRVTNKQSTYNYSPSWNPDKTQIQYREINSSNYIDICVINPDGTGYKNLTNSKNIDEYNVSYSYDGTKLIYTSMETGNEDIWLMNVNGTNKINLTLNSSFDDYRANWSPDGNKIIFISKRSNKSEIYSMNLDGSNVIQLTNSISDISEPKWSPNGTKISYLSKTKGDNTFQIFIMNPDGTGKEQLTNGNDSGIVWSPDGTKIAYNSSKEIRVIDINTKIITHLTNNNSTNSVSGWLLDGSKILFNSDISGGNEIYSIKPNAENLFRLTYNNFSDFNSNALSPSYTFNVQGIKTIKKIKHDDNSY